MNNKRFSLDRNTKTSLIYKSQPKSFFSRPAELVAPDLIGCWLVKRQSKSKLLCGVIVETEAYSQNDPACHGYSRRSKSNETLFAFFICISIEMVNEIP